MKFRNILNTETDPRTLYILYVLPVFVLQRDLLMEKMAFVRSKQRKSYTGP
jgi:hypothetical protein